MIALSLLLATAIWSFGSFVLTCVGTEESRVDGVEPDRRCGAPCRCRVENR
jgi:hypothetical protein